MSVLIHLHWSFFNIGTYRGNQWLWWRETQTKTQQDLWVLTDDLISTYNSGIQVLGLNIQWKILNYFCQPLIVSTNRDCSQCIYAHTKCIVFQTCISASQQIYKTKVWVEWSNRKYLSTGDVLFTYYTAYLDTVLYYFMKPCIWRDHAQVHSFHSFVRLFVRSFVCLFVRSFIRLFVCLFVCLFVIAFHRMEHSLMREIYYIYHI